MGAAVRSRPVIRSISLAGNQLTLTWCAMEGATYRVETKTDLASPIWNSISGDVLATDAVVSKTFPFPADPQRFFRVIDLQ